uniref:Hpt domain-containing protein n=1 Tax=Brevundimonas sp. TaxID=1871086 RepID=UPI00289C791A
MSDDPFEAIKATFFQECEELLADLEGNLLTLESGSTDIEVINAVFRAVHSVKGGAGAFGLEDLVRFAHVFETLMDELRSGRKPCDELTVKTLLRASDVLADHVAAARGAGAAVDPARSAGLVAELETLTYGGAAPVAAVEPEEDDFGFTPVAMDLGAFDAPAGLPDLPPLPDLAALAPLPDLSALAAAGGWKIVFRPHPRLYASANETGLLLRELGRLGPMRVQMDDSGVPLLDALEPTDSHLIWTIELEGDASEDEVREVFDFVEMDCDLSITPLGDAAPVAPAVAEEAAHDLGDDASALARAASSELDIAALLASVGAAPTEAP